MTQDELDSLLVRLNGFYAIVCVVESRLLALVDHVRSQPLFYAQCAGRLCLSDDADWVRQQVGESVIDADSRAEFLLTGYVTGADTLFGQVKQIQAGEYLEGVLGDAGWRLSAKRHFEFRHVEPDMPDQVALAEGLDRVAVAAVQRMIDVAEGRQIVVPLSGGYDSRLIVTLLRRLEYPNLFAFTYGARGNREVAYSKRVATALGVPWTCIEQSGDVWRSAWQTAERRSYQRWASGWNSLPHVQDWLAMRVLKQQRKIAADVLLAPGHTGDFISGGHIPDVCFDQVQFDVSTAKRAIFNKHYSLVKMDPDGHDAHRYLARLCPNQLHAEPMRAWQCADVCERWEWQERQAKFICNSVRTYEFFGFDWWLPLWDVEFVRFWQTVPLDLRRKRLWYIDYVSRQFSRHAELVGYGTTELNNASDPSRLLSTIGRLPGRQLLRRIRPLRNFLRLLLRLRADQNRQGWEGWFDEGAYADMQARGMTVNGMVAVEFLRDCEDELVARSALGQVVADRTPDRG
jgi:asparagine synthase (glutamine-hydrolysing)